MSKYKERYIADSTIYPGKICRSDEIVIGKYGEEYELSSYAVLIGQYDNYIYKVMKLFKWPEYLKEDSLYVCRLHISRYITGYQPYYKSKKRTIGGYVIYLAKQSLKRQIHFAKTVKTALNTKSHIYMYYLSDYDEDDSKDREFKLLGVETDNPEVICDSKRNLDRIIDVIKRLDEDSIKILCYRFEFLHDLLDVGIYEKKNFEEIGKEFGISKQAVHIRYCKIINKLRIRLGKLWEELIGFSV